MVVNLSGDRDAGEVMGGGHWGSRVVRAGRPITGVRESGGGFPENEAVVCYLYR